MSMKLNDKESEATSALLGLHSMKDEGGKTGPPSPKKRRSGEVKNGGAASQAVNTVNGGEKEGGENASAVTTAPPPSTTTTAATAPAPASAPASAPPRSALPASSSANPSRRWSREEDDALRAGVDELGPRDWKRISEEFLGGKRKDIQCYQRWERTLKPGVKVGPWTKEEDDILRKCMADGMTKWSDIAKLIPGRLSKRVRERWTCQLDPARKEKEKCPWTPQEEAILFEAQGRLGNKWVDIAKLLPGRSENDVKNRAYCELRKKERKAKNEAKGPSSSSSTTKSTTKRGTKRTRAAAAAKGGKGGKGAAIDTDTDRESMVAISTMYQAAMYQESQNKNQQQQEQEQPVQPEGELQLPPPPPPQLQQPPQPPQQPQPPQPPQQYHHQQQQHHHYHQPAPLQPQFPPVAASLLPNINRPAVTTTTGDM